MGNSTSRRKIHPKLRMMEHGSSSDYARRTETSASMCIPKDVKAATAEDVLISVFVQTTNGQAVQGIAENKAIHETGSRGQLRTMRLPLSEVQELADARNVMHLELGEPLAEPTPIVVPEYITEAKKPPDFKKKHLHKYGKDVLIGIIDVQGFDFAHPDFLTKDGKTRWMAIWDQGGTGKAPRRVKDDLTADYGNELEKKDMDAAIKASKTRRVPATMLEPQSQMKSGSHGTHVASIAAGNSGICRNAMIAGVLIALPEGDTDRRRSFYDSTRIAHAVDYLVELSKKLAIERKRPTPFPLSINISLGTNGHAHDASAAISRWLDNAMSTPGRCLSVAAGNAGQEKAAFEGDLGYIMGRIHTSGRIGSRGLGTDIEWIVIGDGRTDISENELEFWYSPQDRFNVQLRPPGGDWTEVITPGTFIHKRRLENGATFSIYNEIYHPANGANYISLYLSPSSDGRHGIPPGQWTVRLIGDEVRDGRYHGWIERDDPGRIGRVVDGRDAWRFPSFFSERSNVDESSVSSLACGMRVLSVANLDFARERINMTSSQGPTRDGRFKPDVAAPGTDIVAAKGFAGANDLWVKMTGTSMASPYACGVAGLMLAIENGLTAAQIEGIIQRTASPLPGGSYSWINDAGFGKIEPDKCLEEASMINNRRQLRRR